MIRRLNATEYDDILDHNIYFPQRLVFGPFLFQHEHKASALKAWFSRCGIKELDWPVESPDLNPI